MTMTELFGIVSICIERLIVMVTNCSGIIYINEYIQCMLSQIEINVEMMANNYGIQNERFIKQFIFSK